MNNEILGKKFSVVMSHRNSNALAYNLNYTNIQNIGDIEFKSVENKTKSSTMTVTNKRTNVELCRMTSTAMFRIFIETVARVSIQSKRYSFDFLVYMSCDDVYCGDALISLFFLGQTCCYVTYASKVCNYTFIHPICSQQIDFISLSNKYVNSIDFIKGDIARQHNLSVGIIDLRGTIGCFYLIRVDEKGCYVLDSRDDTIERYSQKSFQDVLKSGILIKGVAQACYSNDCDTAYSDSKFFLKRLEQLKYKKQLVSLQLTPYSY